MDTFNNTIAESTPTLFHYHHYEKDEDDKVINSTNINIKYPFLDVRVPMYYVWNLAVFDLLFGGML